MNARCSLETLEGASVRIHCCYCLSTLHSPSPLLCLATSLKKLYASNGSATTLHICQPAALPTKDTSFEDHRLANYMYLCSPSPPNYSITSSPHISLLPTSLLHTSKLLKNPHKYYNLKLTFYKIQTLEFSQTDLVSRWKLLNNNYYYVWFRLELCSSPQLWPPFVPNLSFYHARFRLELCSSPQQWLPFVPNLSFYYVWFRLELCSSLMIFKENPEPLIIIPNKSKSSSIFTRLGKNLSKLAIPFQMGKKKGKPYRPPHSSQSSWQGRNRNQERSRSPPPRNRRASMGPGSFLQNRTGQEPIRRRNLSIRVETQPRNQEPVLIPVRDPETQGIRVQSMDSAEDPWDFLHYVEKTRKMHQLRGAILGAIQNHIMEDVEENPTMGTKPPPYSKFPQAGNPMGKNLAPTAPRAPETNQSPQNPNIAQIGNPMGKNLSQETPEKDQSPQLQSREIQEPILPKETSQEEILDLEKWKTPVFCPKKLGATPKIFPEKHSGKCNGWPTTQSLSKGSPNNLESIGKSTLDGEIPQNPVKVPEENFLGKTPQDEIPSEIEKIPQEFPRKEHLMEMQENPLGETLQNAKGKENPPTGEINPQREIPAVNGENPQKFPKERNIPQDGNHHQDWRDIKSPSENLGENLQKVKANQRKADSLTTSKTGQLESQDQNISNQGSLTVDIRAPLMKASEEDCGLSSLNLRLVQQKIFELETTQILQGMQEQFARHQKDMQTIAEAHQVTLETILDLTYKIERLPTLMPPPMQAPVPALDKNVHVAPPSRLKMATVTDTSRKKSYTMDPKSISSDAIQPNCFNGARPKDASEHTWNSRIDTVQPIQEELLKAPNTGQLQLSLRPITSTMENCDTKKGIVAKTAKLLWRQLKIFLGATLATLLHPLLLLLGALQPAESMTPFQEEKMSKMLVGIKNVIDTHFSLLNLHHIAITISGWVVVGIGVIAAIIVIAYRCARNSGTSQMNIQSRSENFAMDSFPSRGYHGNPELGLNHQPSRLVRSQMPYTESIASAQTHTPAFGYTGTLQSNFPASRPPQQLIHSGNMDPNHMSQLLAGAMVAANLQTRPNHFESGKIEELDRGQSQQQQQQHQLPQLQMQQQLPPLPQAQPQGAINGLNGNEINRGGEGHG